MRSGVGLVVVLVTATACTPDRVEPVEAAPAEPSAEQLRDAQEYAGRERARLIADASARVKPIGAPPRAFRQSGPSSEMLAQAASVQLEAGLLQFRGVIRAGDPCVSLVPGVTTAKGELTLHLQIVEATEPCSTDLASIPYEGTVDVPGPGSLRVRVVQTYPGTGWDTAAVLDTTVVVP